MKFNEELYSLDLSKARATLCPIECFFLPFDASNKTLINIIKDIKEAISGLEEDKISKEKFDEIIKKNTGLFLTYLHEKEGNSTFGFPSFINEEYIKELHKKEE